MYIEQRLDEVHSNISDLKRRLEKLANKSDEDTTPMRVGYIIGMTCALLSMDLQEIRDIKKDVAKLKYKEMYDTDIDDDDDDLDEDGMDGQALTELNRILDKED
jgi:hypothetical protein